MIGAINLEIEKGSPGSWQFEVIEIDEGGIQKSLPQGETFYCTVEGKAYEITVDSASPDSATISLGEESIILSPGDKKNVDLDGDGENEMGVEMVEGENGSATLLMSATSSSSTSDSGTDYLMLLAGVAVGAVIAALAVFMVMRKKKAT
jgi:hypothetical protein